MICKMSEITLEDLKLSELVEYSNNAKEHPADQVEKIRDSIVSFDYLDPIAVDENNIIIEGHGRLMALKQINSDMTKKIKVLRITGMTEAGKKAYRIAHNKLNADSGFDLDKLGKEFNALEDSDFFGDTGFSTGEISEVWEKKDTSEITDSDKTTVIEHTCPECGHNWEQEIKKSNKRL